MNEKINEEVSVALYYSAKHKKVMPHQVSWRGKDYLLGKVDYYHTYMEGRDRQHIFELVDKDMTLYFKLRLDSSNLHWTLEAVHDGLAN